MIEWFKANPWMWAIGGLMLLVSIVGVIVGILKKGFWKDRGFLNQGKAYWKQESLPIPVFFASDIDGIVLDYFYQVREEINNLAGRLVLSKASEWLAQVPKRADGFIFFHTEMTWPGEYVSCGKALVRTDKKTGVIVGVDIFIRGAFVYDFKIIKHELGHALGLDHDEHPSSVMYPTLEKRPQDFSDNDKQLLKETYGELDD